MYNYSPITKIKVRNFRNIGDVEIDFTKSPIVTLVGENEAGKTSIIKAFSTCALHDSPREQKDFIRDETKMFGVEIDLEDGTQIVRIKELNGLNMYRVIRPDGTVWDTNKIAEGLPLEVSSRMGLIVEPETNEYLQVRTYEDKLLFVVTPSSTNYKVMYNALKVEQLTKAIKLGSNEVNSYKALISRNESSIETLEDQLSEIKQFDLEPLINIRDRLIKQVDILGRLEKLKELSNKICELEGKLGALALIDIYGLNTISEASAVRLNNINRLLNSREEIKNKIEKLEVINGLEEINLDTVKNIGSVIEKKRILEEKINNSKWLIDLQNLTDIDEGISFNINRIKQSLDRLNMLNNMNNKIDISSCREITQSDVDIVSKLSTLKSKYDIIDKNKSDLEKIVAYIDSVQDYLKQCGVAVEACPKCGEAVIFDIDKLGG